MAKILIIGCGSIGTQLASHLSGNGHQVTGLKRHPPVVSNGDFTYFPADISLVASLENLATDFDQIFFIVSPDARAEQSYRDIYELGLNNCLQKFSQIPWIFVSSTSVYAQSKGEWVDENSVAKPEDLTSQLIRRAEQRVIAINPKNIIVRFSGIYGPGREYLINKAKQTPVIQRKPPYYTNRIHEQDCVGVLEFLFEQRLQGKVMHQCYLASDNDPAPLWEVMSWLADRLCIAPPQAKEVSEQEAMNKQCKNERLKALGYKFQYPVYKDGYGALIKKTY